MAEARADLMIMTPAPAGGVIDEDEWSDSTAEPGYGCNCPADAAVTCPPNHTGLDNCDTPFDWLALVVIQAGAAGTFLDFDVLSVGGRDWHTHAEATIQGCAITNVTTKDVTYRSVN